METSKTADTAKTVDTVYELSTLLNTGLSRRSVQIIMALIDAGCDPVALAKVVQELKEAVKTK
jgi:mitotic-spindle organizing protein 1